MPIRTSSAVWRGGLKSGEGMVTVGKGVFEGAYSFPSRFEKGTGTNPPDLVYTPIGGTSLSGDNPSSCGTRA